jgi:hypothetical protein
MLPSSTVENYLKAIYLGAGSLGPGQRLLPMGQLAAALGVAPRTLAQTNGGNRPPPPPGTRLVLLGTRGGPGVALERSESASAVVVDGVPYLVDCGYGTMRALVSSGIGFLPVSSSFARAFASHSLRRSSTCRPSSARRS